MKHIIISLALIFAFISCANTSKNEEATSVQIEEGTLHILSFHNKKRCITCNAIETLTREVVAELNNPKIVLRVMEISENEDVANEYEVSWSSLILDNGTSSNNITQMAFQHAKNEPEIFKAKLKEEISNMMK